MVTALHEDLHSDDNALHRNRFSRDYKKIECDIGIRRIGRELSGPWGVGLSSRR